MRIFLSLLLCLFLTQANAAPFKQICPGNNALCQPIVSAITPPAIDVFVTGTAQGATTLTVSITATKSNDLICAFVKTATGGGVVTGVTDTSSLSWSRRQRVLFDNTNAYIEEWCALSTGIYSGTISAVQTNNGTGIVSALAISNVDQVTQFDTNASLPISHGLTSTATSIAPSSSLSTTSSNTLFLSIVAWNTSGTLTLPSGFTSLATTTSRAYAYEIFTSAQSGLSPSTSNTSSSLAGGLWDAVRGAR